MLLRRALLVLLLAAAAAYDAVVVGGHFAAPHAAGIDFGVYYRAAQALAHGRSLYGTPPPCCFSAAAMTGYTYPPLFAALLVPLTALPVDDAGRLWLALDCVALGLMVFLGARAAPGRIGGEALAWIVLLVLSSGAVLAALYEIQATPVAVALEAAFAWTVVRGRAALPGGAALALAGAVKGSPLLLVPSLLAAPRRFALRSLVAVLVALLALAAVMLALSPQVFFYLGHVLPSFSSGVVSSSDRSLPGVLLRLLAAAGVTPPAALSTAFLVVEAAAIAVTVALCRGVAGPAGRALVVAGLLAVIPIVQGVTWDHHLVSEPLALLLIAPLLRRFTPRWWLAVGGTVLAMVNQPTIDTWLAARGWEPPHGGLQFTVFALQALINLAGMCALWLAVVFSARAERTS